MDGIKVERVHEIRLWGVTRDDSDNRGQAQLWTMVASFLNSFFSVNVHLSCLF